MEHRYYLPEEAIDTHVHVGDINHLDGGFRRQFTITELNALGLVTVAKAHFLPFVPEMQFVYGSMTLNNGLNPDFILQARREMTKPWVVWFPTLNAKNHHDVVAHDTAWAELFKDPSLGEPISVLDLSGQLTTQVQETIYSIAEAKAILATGHLSAQEVNSVVPFAISVGVRAIVLTHVSSRHNRINVDDQKRLIGLGLINNIPVYAEHCAITWIDGKEGAYDLARDFVQPIKLVGPEFCLLSSDCGRVVSPNSNKPATPQECLGQFTKSLTDNGLSNSDIYKMVVINPRKLLGLR